MKGNFAAPFRRLAGLLVLAVCLGSAEPALAAAWRAECTPLTTRPRTHAPVLVEVKLQYPGPRVLEGVLEIAVVASGETILHQHTQELALAGPQTLRLLLPPLPIRPYERLTEAVLHFRTRTEKIALGTFPIAASLAASRQYVIANSGAGPAPKDDTLRLWQQLRLERFDAGEPPPSTALISLEPEDFPTSPLAWCAFDLVLLEGRSFAALREKQLAALTRWIEGGGSLLVSASGVLRDEQMNFLNRLAARSDGAAPFTRDESGRIVDDWSGVASISAGLGRVVVLAQDADAQFDRAAWAKLARFLWKGRGQWISRDDRDSARTAPGRGPNSGPTWTRPGQRATGFQEVLSTLLPQSSRLVPLPIIAAILGAFVLVVGPGEWFVLGALRRRRWTWITFPLCALACTALTVAAAEHYLGTTDHRAAVIITDLAADGRPLRESRLELLFAARDKDGVVELRQNLAVPTQVTLSHRYDPHIAEPPIYAGQVPARAELRGRLRQWTPAVYRTLSFEPGAAPLGFRWPATTARELAAQADPARWLATQAAAPGLAFYVWRRDRFSQSAEAGPSELNFLRSISLFPPSPTGQMLTRLAPGGGADLQDLPLLAWDSQDDWIVFAVQKSPQEMRIHRCVYPADD